MATHKFLSHLCNPWSHVFSFTT